MQVFGDNAEVVNDGKVDGIEARLPRPLLFCSLRAFNHVASQVYGSAVGTKITNTGTNLGDGPAGTGIGARSRRPSTSESLNASLARRSCRLRPRSR